MTEFGSFVHYHIRVGDDLLEFHQAVVSTLREADEAPVPLDPAPSGPPIAGSQQMSGGVPILPNIHQDIAPTNPLLGHTTEDMQKVQEWEVDMLRFGADQHDENSADNGKTFDFGPQFLLLFFFFGFE